MIYKTFEEWKAGHWLEDGEPRTEAYTEDELLLIEMGWRCGCRSKYNIVFLAGVG